MTLRPLLAYLPWHARDAFVRSLVSVLLFSLIAGIVLPLANKETRGVGFAGTPEMVLFAEGFYAEMGGLTLFLGALLVMSQVIAKDRERQYFRFLFAHQVAPWAYYLQRFVVGVLLYAVCFLIVPVVYSQMVVPVPVLATLVAALLLGAFFGALTMLAGAITQRDGLIVILVWLVANILQTPNVYDALPTWGQWFSKALPAVYAVSEVSKSLVKGLELQSGLLWLALAWTAGMLVASLVVVRRTPLAR